MANKIKTKKTALLAGVIVAHLIVIFGAVKAFSFFKRKKKEECIEDNYYHEEAYEN